MSLTLGSAPFGQWPAGAFNFELPRRAGVIYFEDSPRRIRGMLGGETVVDSTRAKLLHESGHLPVHYFPQEDLRADLLAPSDHTTHCPFKGDAAYWTIRAGDRVAENVVWGYDAPLPDAPPLAGYRAVYWGALDHWYEEDEEVFVHPRDPYHRVDALPSSRHVVVSVGGQVLADTRRSVALFETSLPSRWYIPRDDVRLDLMTASDTVTECPYKGRTSAYWSVSPGGDEITDIAWSYEEPIAAVAPIAARVAFFNEWIDLEIDGESVPRPASPWARRPHAAAP